MSYCAYELDIDITTVKKELLQIYNDLENTERQITLDIANLQRQKFRKSLSCI